jgi:DivIVA domain-containing protein
MADVEFDRQAIEKRDFPIVRRGYDPAAVDAHLRALAAEIEELQRATSAGGPDASLASTAGTQVQSILHAAETAAADIERQARQSASEARVDADQDAARTRKEAVAQAQAHVAAVAQATAMLLERVASMDGEATALSESLSAGASRLAADLAAVETNMGELYDAASGRAASGADAGGARAAVQAEVADSSGASAGQGGAAAEASTDPPARPASSSGKAPAPSGAPAGGELDSARLVALNMALNGESRTDAERYLAEHFELIDRQKLVDEVYAAIEG